MLLPALVLCSGCVRARDRLQQQCTVMVSPLLGADTDTNSYIPL